MSSEDERRMVLSVLGGDKAAFGQLIDRYRAGAIAFARRLLGDSDAKDAAQEAFVAAFLGLNKLRRKEAFRPGCFGILVNLCRSRLRSRRSEYFQDFLGGEAIAGFRLQDWAPSAEAIFEVRELHRLVAEAIATLPSQQRESVSLHYLKGLRLSEIASLTGSPIGTVKARLHNARNALRDSLLSEIGRTPGQWVDRWEAKMIEVIVQDKWFGRRRMSRQSGWPSKITSWVYCA